MSNNEDPVERFVAFVEGQAQRFVDPDRRRLDDAVMRVHDWLTGSQLDPHDQTVVRTFHSVMQLLADQAGRQVARRSPACRRRALGGGPGHVGDSADRWRCRSHDERGTLTRRRQGS